MAVASENQDRKAGGAIERLGVSPRGRALLFYGVCIWLRLGIAFAVYYGLKELKHDSEYDILLGVLIAVAAVSLLQNVRPGRLVDQWWIREAHAITGIAVIVTCIVALVVDKDDFAAPYVVGGIFAGDVLFGVLTSFVKCPFRPREDSRAKGANHSPL